MQVFYSPWNPVGLGKLCRFWQSLVKEMCSAPLRHLSQHEMGDFPWGLCNIQGSRVWFSIAGCEQIKQASLVSRGPIISVWGSQDALLYPVLDCSGSLTPAHDPSLGSNHVLLSHSVLCTEAKHCSQCTGSKGIQSTSWLWHSVPVEVSDHFSRAAPWRVHCSFPKGQK